VVEVSGTAGLDRYLQDVFREDAGLRTWQSDVQPYFYSHFQPRANRPEVFDEQKAFCDAKDQVSWLVGGNASGTTECACFKMCQFVLHQQEAPRKDTPFWIISNTYEQVCGTIWAEKLVGHGHLPKTEVNWDRIRWMSAAAQWPFTVPLLPWKNGDPNRNWMLEFKSYEQGRRALQARSIGGFFFSEQFPIEVFLETLRGCREYMYPGAQFCEFTPVEPELCIWVEKLMEKPPPGWGFYRANTAENKSNLADGWFDQFFASVPDELLQTRLTGALATYEGVVYEAFNPKVHVVGDEVIDPRRSGVFHYRGIDWGASVEHPFCCLWAYRDGIGDWHVYDEYWNPKQNMTGLDHIAEIKRRWPWPEDSPYFGKSFADPSRPDMFNLFNQFDIDCQQGMNDVYKGIDTVRSLLQLRQETQQPKLFIHGKRCPHLIEEMRKYRWLRGRKPSAGHFLNPKTARPIPLKRDDDTCDALRYMVHTVESTQGIAISSARYKEQDQVHRAVQLALGNGWRAERPKTALPSNAENPRFKAIARLNGGLRNGNGKSNGNGGKNGNR
jgi:phage terminase large subunit-like protein